MEKKSIIITVILLLILGVLIFMLFKEFGKGFNDTEKNNIKQDNNLNNTIDNNENLNLAPSIPSNQGPKINNEEIINPKIDYTNSLTEEEIIGKWIATSENTRGEIITNLENYSIEFKTDKKYISIVVGYLEEGTYEIKENNITFYDKENNLPTPAFGSIENDNLIITYPQYPKIVAYKKEN